MSNSEVPYLCTNCLGLDSNVRMIKQSQGETCKVCTRPFTVFRWQVDDGSNRSKKTLICRTCAVLKNCCQSCMLDVNFMIPTDIRDTSLKMAGLDHLVHEYSSSRNAEVKAIIADKQDAKVDLIQNNAKAQEILQKLASVINGSKAIEGTKKNSKSIQKETISGTLSKAIKSLPFSGSIVPTEESKGGFFVFGFPEDLPQYAISDFFEKYGKIKAISIVHKARCGFISLTSHKVAEKLAEEVTQNGLNKNPGTPGLVLLNKSVPVRIASSAPKQLGVSSVEHKKLSLVVAKIMEQLAEKDRKYESKSKGTKTQSRPLKQETVTQKSPKYQASSADFEL